MTTGRRGLRGLSWRLVLAACWATAAVSSAEAANWFSEAGLSSQLTYTDNSGIQSGAERRSDTLLDVAPSWVVRGVGPRFTMSAAGSVNALTYLNGTQSSGLTPTGNLNANFEAIERWLFVDAGVFAVHSAENPLGPRPDGGSTVNRLTTTQSRLSPYVDRALPGDLRVLLRSDNSWTDTSGAAAGASHAYSARHRALLEAPPRAFGWAVEAERSENRVSGDNVSTPDVDLVRLRLRYALGGQWIVGLRGGSERSDLFGLDDRRQFAGGEIVWQPSERTRLDGFWENRAFGGSWVASLSHRMPRLALNLNLVRELTSASQPQLTLQPTGDVAAQIDAALRTRIADPIERARAVEDFLRQQSLPRSLDRPLIVLRDQLLVRTSRAATLTWLLGRATLVVNGFSQRDQPATGNGLRSLPTADDSELVQRGAGLTVAHRLLPRATVSATLSWLWTDRQSTASAAESRQRTYRLQYDYQLAAKTSAFSGVRHQAFELNAISASRETGVFAGLAHRF